MVSAFTFQPLGADHNRAAFSCGNASLDDFIQTKARKERDLNYCTVFVMQSTADPTAILGYYTLSSHSIELTGIDANVRKKYPRYPLVPTTLLGRLARSSTVHGTGAGETLLLEALKTAERGSQLIGSHAVVVDAIDENAIIFYQRYGFIPLLGQQNRLYLPMETIRKLEL